MKIAAIRLDPQEWEQFHSPTDPNDVFFAITTALQRASTVVAVGPDGRRAIDHLCYNSDDVPSIAHGAIVFHQAWHAFDGGYDTNNPFHGYTDLSGTKAGFVRNVRSLREFLAALPGDAWDGALAEVIAAAEAIPLASWEGDFGEDFFWGERGCRLRDIFSPERNQQMITLDIFNKAAASVQSRCPVSR